MALNINGTTGISGVDGSVSAPAVTGTDSNTGITFPAADTIKFSTGGVERMSITNSDVVGAGGGKVLQFVFVELTSTTSWASASYVDITGMTATINGVSSGSKIIIDFNLNLGRSHNTGALFKLFRDSTFLPSFSAGAFTFKQNEYHVQATYETTNVNFRFVDTHGQSAGSNITYKMQGGNGESDNYVNYLNRANYNSTQWGGSLITLTEME